VEKVDKGGFNCFAPLFLKVDIYKKYQMKQKNICKGLTFNDCELAILRMAVDKAEEKIGRRIVNSEEIKKIIKIVEDFIKVKNLICYGGTAINNILPTEDQFYNKDVEIPDYDFFTMNAVNDAKELADIYYKAGFTDVEAKSGQHHGTYKVFVNYIPVADITYLPKGIYSSLKKDALRVGGILYTPPNYLRMAMYLELSRPAGDTSRWEKVMKRLSLLNKHYPVTDLNCNEVDFQREMSFASEDTYSNKSNKSNKSNESNENLEDEIYENVRNTLVNQGVVFFGGYAISIYAQHMPNHLRRKLFKIPDFDVLSEEPTRTAQIIKERLNDMDVKNVKIIRRPAMGEIVATHYEIRVGNDTVAFIYEPLACHSYNIIKESGQDVKVATIDTMLSFYLAFLYADRPYYDKNRILCMSKYLFEVQEKNRLSQKGVLKRFSINCMGHQETIEEMRAEKAEKFKELKDKKNTAEYDAWFLRYRPTDTKKEKSEEEEDKDSKEKKASSPKNKTKRPHALKKKRKTKTKKTSGFFF
jgi:hypothetical protein